MPSVNKVILIGHLGKDPEMRFTPNGSPVTNFSVATSSYSGKGEEKKETTEWHNIVCWNRTAEFANQYLLKGSLVYVEGRIQTRSWQDNEGATHYKTEIVANQVNALSKAQTRDEEASEVEPEEIPF